MAGDHVREIVQRSLRRTRDRAEAAIGAGSGDAELLGEAETLRAVRQRLAGCKEQVGQLQAPTCSRDRPSPTHPLLPDGALCVICHGPLRNCVALAPCGHTFCSRCVEPWITRAGSCPTCRSVVPTMKKSMRVRVVDELIEALLNSRSVQDSAMNSSNVGEDSANGRSASLAVEAAPRRQVETSLGVDADIGAAQHRLYVAEEGEASSNVRHQRSSHTSDSLTESREAEAAGMCSICERRAATEMCGPCGWPLGFCLSCALGSATQCENCEAWFCSDWCAAAPCHYCARPHVCASCHRSALRRCPRPEC